MALEDIALTIAVEVAYSHDVPVAIGDGIDVQALQFIAIYSQHITIHKVHLIQTSLLIALEDVGLVIGVEIIGYIVRQAITVCVDAFGN